PPQVVHIPAGRGIDESQRPEHIPAGAANQSNVNVRLDLRGALIKRPGYTYLPLTRLDGTSRSAGRKMFGRGHEICVLDQHTLDFYIPSLGVNVNVDRIPELTVERFPVCGIPSLSNITLLDADTGIAHANGLYWILYITEAVGGVLWTLNVIVVDQITHSI